MNVLVVASLVCAMAAGCLLAWWYAGRLDEEKRRKRQRQLFMGSWADDATARGKGLGIARHAKAKRLRQERRAQAERHMPEMIDALSLGLGAGLSFESAFRLYCVRFDDPLARECKEAYRTWESGLVLREEALRKLAEELDAPIMQRFVSNVLRSLKFGSPLNHTLEALAEEARSSYRAQMEEKVAKAPAKMLMPTTALILPAMLIMVMAPIVLDFA